MCKRHHSLSDPILNRQDAGTQGNAKGRGIFLATHRVLAPWRLNTNVQWISKLHHSLSDAYVAAKTRERKGTRSDGRLSKINSQIVVS